MTGQDLIKEILMFVPELRGSVETVKSWINQAVRDIEGTEDWEYMISEIETTAGEDIHSPLDMTSMRPKRVFEFMVAGRPLTLVEPFYQFVNLNVSGDVQVFYSLKNDMLYWKPEVPIGSGVDFMVRFFARSPEIDESTSNNWLLNNAYNLVKYKTLMNAAAYTKNIEMLKQYGGLYQLELEELRKRFGIMTDADRQMLVNAQQQTTSGGNQ